MCDLGHHQNHDFGFIVDVPEIRALIDEARRIADSIPDNGARVDSAQTGVCPAARRRRMAAR